MTYTWGHNGKLSFLVYNTECDPHYNAWHYKSIHITTNNSDILIEENVHRSSCKNSFTRTAVMKFIQTCKNKLKFVHAHSGLSVI